MLKFVRVKTAPTELKKGEYVISEPNFVPEIAACKKKKPRSKIMTTNYLREIVATIGMKYADEDFNALIHVNISQYVGSPCGTDSQTNDVVVKLFEKQYPQMLDNFVSYHIKQRPHGTNTIYFLGRPYSVAPFIANGIEEVLEKDLKEKKVVGKPAVTNEEAQNLKLEQENQV